MPNNLNKHYRSSDIRKPLFSLNVTYFSERLTSTNNILRIFCFAGNDDSSEFRSELVSIKREYGENISHLSQQVKVLKEMLVSAIKLTVKK